MFHNSDEKMVVSLKVRVPIVDNIGQKSGTQ